MYLYKKTFLVISLLGYLFSESGYNTIYLMEFENQQNEFTNSHMAQALPDLIKENYKFRNDINIEYAGDIRPYLEQNSTLDEEIIKGLVINGRFLTLNDEFFVEFEAYDIQSWKRLVRRQLFCPIYDLICVHDGFIMAIEESISPFLNDALDVDATILSLDTEPNKRTPSLELDNSLDTNQKQLDDLGDRNGVNEQGQYGSRHYREFNLKEISPNPSIIRKGNSDKLIKILDQFLLNPYDVVIGDIKIEDVNSSDENLIGEIPINFSIRSNLAQELINNLPHQKIVDNMGNIILQFSKEEFIFEGTLLEKIALMKFQLLPVIFFNSRIGSIQFIILDSWNEKYTKLELNNVPLYLDNQFRPLFSLTPGVDKIQLDLDVSTLQLRYRFNVPRNLLGDYTKVTVKFLKNEELEELINKQSHINNFLENK